MLRLRLALILAAAATLAFANASNATLPKSSTSPPPSASSILSTPSSLPDLSSPELPTDAALLAQTEDTTLSLCRCLFNDAVHKTELVCASPKDSEPESLDLNDLLLSTCQFVKIDVSNVDLTYVSGDAFVSTPDLEVVYLYSDFIEQIDREAFRVLGSLVDVDLSDNSLLFVEPRLFVDNPLLKSVSLTGNSLVELVPNAPILESTSITQLDLSMCKLTTLTVESFSKLPNLQRLDLSANNIQQLPVAALQSMPQLSALNIGNNRWSCDCAFKVVLEFARTMEETDSQVRCFAPNMVMEYWSDKTAQKYCPEQDLLEDKASDSTVKTEGGDEYDDSSSEEYDEEYEDIDAPQTIDVADMMQSFDDLQKDTKDLRKEMIDLVDAEAVTEDVDETQDTDEAVEEVIFVIEGDDADAGAGVVPAAVLVFVLAALTVFGVGLAVVVCRAVVRSDPGSQGWSELDEEGGGDVVYKKVPLN